MRRGWVERGTVLIRLTRPHFAFYRGYLDNLELRALANAYLENVAEDGDEETDLRVIRSSTKWIRDQLVVLARRAQLRKNARLIQIKPERLRLEHKANVPTLEDFREEADPFEMFSEEDLLEMFRDKYGPTERQSRLAVRNDRLRRQQRAALLQLEELAGADPKLADRVDGWLDPAIATRLRDARIHTIADLIAKIHSHGYRWYTKVPRVGEKAAIQILRWLTTESVSDALGVTIHMRGLVKQRDLPAKVPALYPPRTDIVPLERLLIPAELDGSNGSNRGERTLLNANRDIDAITEWLKTTKGGHTYRSYQKEAERFVLWCIVEKQKPLSSLTVDDCIDYRDFLWYLGSTVERNLLPDDAIPLGADTDAADPRASATYRPPPTITVFETDYWHTRFRLPQERWIGPHSTPRWSPLWKPFEGRLSPSSQALALTILKAMMRFLQQFHYLHGNPMEAVKPLAVMAERIDTSRAFSRAEWDAVASHLKTLKRETDSTPEECQANDRYHRLRFILSLAYSTGLRLSELTGLRKESISSFVQIDSGKTNWVAKVVGKGSKERTVDLPSGIMREMDIYFIRRGHQRFATAPKEVPVIASLPKYDKDGIPIAGSLDDALSDRRLYKILKRFFAEVADSLRSESPDMADRLAQASTHWLRHTYATHAIENGFSVDILRKMLGHVSISTTSIYLTAERDRSAKEAEEKGPVLTFE